MRRLILATVVLAAASLPAWSQTIAITGGKIYPVSGPPIANGTVVIRDGVIFAVGANVNIPAGAQRIDATGKVVTPGLINSITNVGLVEIGQVRDTNDAAAKGSNNIAAAFKVWEGLNPASSVFAPTRSEGVTTVIITPHGGLVSGQAAAIDLATGQRSEVIRRSPVAMIAQIDDSQSAGTNSRGELIGKLRILFADVKFYMTHLLDYDRAATRTL